MDAEYLDEFIEKVDLIQIGARNMQNFDLLKKVGKATQETNLVKKRIKCHFPRMDHVGRIYHGKWKSKCYLM